MLTLHVFDPAMCCSSGVCGPDPDPRLPRFAADLAWLESQGVRVTRRNLAQEPAAFADNAAVKRLLEQWGQSCLPVILCEDRVVVRGRYPRRPELAALVGLAVEGTPA